MTASKIVAAASSGSGGGSGLDVDEAFSTHLYTGNGNTQAITNGIDLSGEGGMVWLARRTIPNHSQSHFIVDTERGGNKFLQTYGNAAQSNDNSMITSFNSNGFTMGNTIANTSGNDVSWTFRKAPKFFDVVTYTGNGSNQNISHNLGTTPGFVVVKKTSGTGNWSCWHRSLDSDDYIILNTTAAAVAAGGSYNRTVNSTTYQIFGDYSDEGANGQTYVMYLFAHNDSGDGEFGPSGDQDIIKCGSYTGNETSPPEINLGFEPQWVLIKRATAIESWAIFDNKRGVATGNNDAMTTIDALAEYHAANQIEFTSTGFKLTTAGLNATNTTGTYIYMAIRRGPLAVPTDATKVFHVNSHSGNSNSNIFNTGFDVDMNINTTTVQNPNYLVSRLTNEYLATDSTTADNTLPLTIFGSKSNIIDLETGWWGTTNTLMSYSWRRAPGYFDVLTWSGDGVVDRTISHNLGAVPEMWWIKQRDGTGHWGVQHKVFPSIDKQLYLNLNGSYGSGYSNFIAPTSTSICVGGYGVLGGTSNSNSSGAEYIGFLFATATGVSKVGSFTGAGSDVTVDCGFSNGAKFVMVKDASATDDWYYWDSVRGIVAGNDSYLELNTNNAENTGTDYIDPHSSGFIITSGFMQSGRTYIFYAIA
jgi:hypothetical protein